MRQLLQTSQSLINCLNPPRLGLFSAALAVTILLAACASGPNYTKPTAERNDSPGSKQPESGASAQRRMSVTTIDLKRSRDSLLQQLPQAFAKSAFTVDGVDRSKGIIQLRYSGDPAGYIDCGRVTSVVTSAKGERNYDFPAAKAYQQYELQNRDTIYLVDRRMSLEALVSLKIETIAPSRSRVTLLTARYNVTRDQIARASHAKPLAVTDTISFQGMDGTTFTNAATRCQATGALEDEAMKILKRFAAR